MNRNAIPFDERPPMNPSGLRIGTPALTTRGLLEDDMREIAQVISVALSDRFEAERETLSRAHPGADGALSALSGAGRDSRLAPASAFAAASRDELRRTAERNSSRAGLSTRNRG